MYPIKFEHLYFDKIWGGRDFENFRDDLPTGNIGESWDIACHANGTGKIVNGELKGLTLKDLMEKNREDILGKCIKGDRFPLLLKLINAKDNLSVQVHPDDEYGLKVEGELGKTEAWYVVDAEKGARLVVGTKNCTKEQFKMAIENGSVESYMNSIEVSKGDVFFVKSGLVHAIGEGVVIAEIQQNSDTTYRVYDYNRGRDLHIEKALDVIDFSLKGEKSKGLVIEEDGYKKIYHSLNKYFSLEEYEIYEKLVERSSEDRFFIFTCVEGSGSIVYQNGEETIQKGESVLIPANLGEYTIKGKLRLIKTYVPDVEMMKNEILSRILA